MALGSAMVRCIRLTTLPRPCAVVMKSEILNFLEPSGPIQCCNGTDFTSTFYLHYLVIIIHVLLLKVKKVKVTLVQALRLCTGRTAHRGSRGIALTFYDHGTGRE